MVDVSLSRRRLESDTLVVLVGVLLLTPSLTGQTAPRGMPSKAAAQSQSAPSGLPATQQAKLDKLQAELKSAQAAGDPKAEAQTLNAIGDVYDGVPDYPKALTAYGRARILANSAGDARQEVVALNGLAKNQLRLDESLALYQKALSLTKNSHDLSGRATTLSGMGVIEHRKGLNSVALDDFQRATKLAQLAGDNDLEARILLYTGIVYCDTGQQQEAMDVNVHALSVFQASGNRRLEAAALERIGIVYSATGNQGEALNYFSQALPLLRATHDRAIEAETLANSALASSSLGEEQQALDYFNETQKILQAIGDLRGQSDILSKAVIQLDTGFVYYELGEKEKAIEYYHKALPGLRLAHDRANEAGALEYLGLVCRDLGEKQTALRYYNEAVTMFREARDRDDEARTLDYIGLVYMGFGASQVALERYNQALRLLRDASDRSGEAATLNYIADVYDGLGEKQKALDYYDQALPMAKAVSDPLLEATVSRGLMLSHRDKEPALAVFYGKQAINLLQQVRGNIQGLDKEIQSSFLASKDGYYHDLANLLIAQGRLPEAEQVLDLLKEQEYRDYTRAIKANVLGALTLTPAELQAEEDYQASTAQIVTLGQEWADLRKSGKRTPAQDARLKLVSDQLDAANAGLREYFARLYTLLGDGSDANREVADITGNVSELKQALAKMPHAVALYTLVSEDAYRVIVITGSTQVAREYAIPQEELNRKVAAMAAALEDYNNDAKAPALELYKILMGPVENDLQQAGADTLVWSLDGVLHYVPMAALFDGRQYMVEKYKMATITPASIPRLTDTPDVSRLTVAGMGISQQYQTDLPELPSVVGELDHVVKDPQIKGAVGVLPGQLLLNDAFTEKAMEDELSGQHTVVHIASHFVFSPGDDRQSYLLLADGATKDKPFHLTVADFNDNQNLLLTDTELLTLSACQTGIGGVASNGREVDGLGTTAQKKGAKAVISTLWDVADESTGELMADFYRRWAEGGGKVEKVEALRQAQLDLLLGTGRKGGSQFANPYYWAPFVLMGNWK